MSKAIIPIITMTLLITLSTGCKKMNMEAPERVEMSAVSQDESAPGPPAGEAAPPPPAGARTGRVKETMSTAGYTYVMVDDGTETFWAAAPQFAVAVGDEVAVPPGMAMLDYHSKSLDRDFDVVYFVPAIGTGAGATAAAASSMLPPGHPSEGEAAETADVDTSGLTKPAGDLTVAEIFSRRTELAGQRVRIRGKVVKFSSGIMGKNWIHLQDGTDHEGANDLTVTTSGVAQKGDTAVVTGILATDRDFGAGYRYDVIIEDGSVTVE